MNLFQFVIIWGFDDVCSHRGLQDFSTITRQVVLDGRSPAIRLWSGGRVAATTDDISQGYGPQEPQRWPSVTCRMGHGGNASCGSAAKSGQSWLTEKTQQLFCVDIFHCLMIFLFCTPWPPVGHGGAWSWNNHKLQWSSPRLTEAGLTWNLGNWLLKLAGRTANHTDIRHCCSWPKHINHPRRTNCLGFMMIYDDLWHFMTILHVSAVEVNTWILLLGCAVCRTEPSTTMHQSGKMVPSAPLVPVLPTRTPRLRQWNDGRDHQGSNLNSLEWFECLYVFHWVGHSWPARVTSAKWEAYSQLKVKRVKLVVDNMAAVFSLPATWPQWIYQTPMNLILTEPIANCTWIPNHGPEAMSSGNIFRALRQMCGIAIHYRSWPLHTTPLYFVQRCHNEAQMSTT